MFPEVGTHSIDIESPQRNDKVELLTKEGHVVGIGVVDNSYKTGMELNHLKLFPSEVAVKVVRVVDEMVWTGELVGERLGQCLGFVIR